MLGGKNTKPLGYTIIEVMIVLAVSGVMFLIAANFINGKQQKAAFTQGVNETASRIQDMIEQITDGQYSDIPFGCTHGSPPVISTSVSPTQGTNSPCVFMGKFFYRTGANSYGIFSLAGNRLNSSGKPAVTLGAARPVPIYGSGIDLTTQATVPQNLDLTLHVNGSASQAFGFGFVQGLGSLNASDTINKEVYNSGAQAISLVYAPHLSSSASASELGAVNAIRTPPGLLNASSASLCLTDGTRYAQVLIGESLTNASKLNVTVRVVPVCT